MKPIIGNKDIEENEAITFEKEELELKMIDNHLIQQAGTDAAILDQQKDFIGQLYTAMVSKRTVQQKLNTLAYFETLI